jgi:transglycosylase-like protein with SLT domain
MSMLDAYTRASIERAAAEHGIEPATALAIAERESSFNVHGGSGSALSSAYGLFQLLKSERAQYGGNSDDPAEQADAWARYIQPHLQHMRSVLGREPSGPELYMSHLIGPGRAARIVAGQIAPGTPIQDVMTPRELAANPFMVRAGTAGGLASSVMGDMSRRIAKYGGQGTSMGGAPPRVMDYAEWGEPVEEQSGVMTSAQSALQPGNGRAMKSGAAAPSISDYSQFGEITPEPEAASGAGRQPFSDKTVEDLRWTAGIPMNLDQSQQSENIEDRRNEPPMGSVEAFGRQVLNNITERHRLNNQTPMPLYSQDKMAADAGYNDIGSNLKGP